MAYCSTSTIVRVILAFQVILLYYMFIVNVHLFGQNVQHTHTKAKPSLESVSKQENKLTLGSPGVRLMNAIVTSYREDIRLKLVELVSRKADPDDPELVSLVRELMDPPSGHILKPARHVVNTPQSVEIFTFLNEQVSSLT